MYDDIRQVVCKGWANTEYTEMMCSSRSLRHHFPHTHTLHLTPLSMTNAPRFPTPANIRRAYLANVCTVNTITVSPPFECVCLFRRAAVPSKILSIYIDLRHPQIVWNQSKPQPDWWAHFRENPHTSIRPCRCAYMFDDLSVLMQSICLIINIPYALIIIHFSGNGSTLKLYV